MFRFPEPKAAEERVRIVAGAAAGGQLAQVLDVAAAQHHVVGLQRGNQSRHDIGDVRAGQSGHLALSALPGETIAFKIERVTPVATIRDGRNTFEVEARLEPGDAPLRPGLQGVAKIDAGTQSFAWIWTHRITDWLRLALWSWGG